jgi:hypothetical protein
MTRPSSAVPIRLGAAPQQVDVDPGEPEDGDAPTPGCGPAGYGQGCHNRRQQRTTEATVSPTITHCGAGRVTEGEDPPHPAEQRTLEPIGLLGRPSLVCARAGG